MCTRMVGPLLGLLSILTVLIHASAQPAAAAYRGSEEDGNACTPDVFRLCSKLFQTLPRSRSASNRGSAFSLRDVGPCLRARPDSKCHRPWSDTFSLRKVWRQGCVQHRRFKTQERPA